MNDEYTKRRDEAADNFSNQYIQHGLAEEGFKAGSDWAYKGEFHDRSVCEFRNECMSTEEKLKIAIEALEEIKTMGCYHCSDTAKEALEAINE